MKINTLSKMTNRQFSLLDKKAQSTLSPKIQRIELQVSLYNTEQGKAEAGITNLVFFNYPAKVKTS